MTRARLEDLIGGSEAAHGAARNADWADLPEAQRIEHVKGFGSVPAECGPEIEPSVARGPVRPAQFNMAYIRGDGDVETMPAGHKGRATLVVGDVFDRMVAQAAKKKSRIALTDNQIAMGRLYARMIERHSAGAVRCSSFEGRSGGGGGSSDGFTDARLVSSRRIDLWHQRIGSGLAMEVRRVRKAARPSQVQRVTITARQLVDAVCLEDMEISKVLRRYGWTADGPTIKRCCEALGAILERMEGPAPRGEIRVMRTDQPPNVWGH